MLKKNKAVKWHRFSSWLRIIHIFMFMIREKLVAYHAASCGISAFFLLSEFDVCQWTCPPMRTNCCFHRWDKAPMQKTQSQEMVKVSCRNYVRMRQLRNIKESSSFPHWESVWPFKPKISRRDWHKKGTIKTQIGHLHGKNYHATGLKLHETTHRISLHYFMFLLYSIIDKKSEKWWPKCPWVNVKLPNDSLFPLQIHLHEAHARLRLTENKTKPTKRISERVSIWEVYRNTGRSPWGLRNLSIIQTKSSFKYPKFFHALWQGIPYKHVCCSQSSQFDSLRIFLWVRWCKDQK